MGVLLSLLILSASSQDPATESVSRFYREWSDAAMKKGPAGYASYFAADATLLPPDAPPVRGPRPDQSVEPFETKYLDLLRRGADGRWQFVSRMWNSNIDAGKVK